MDAVVPLWMRAMPLVVALLHAPFSYLWLRGFSSIAMRGHRAALHKDASLHWTQRARLSIAPRSFASSALYIFPCQAAFFAGDSVGSLSFASEACVVPLTALATFTGAYVALRRLGLELGFKRSPLWYDLRATLFGLQGVLTFGAAAFGFWALGDALAKHRFEPLLVALPAIALLSGHVQTFVFRAVGLYREDRALLESLECPFATNLPTHLR